MLGILDVGDLVAASIERRAGKTVAARPTVAVLMALAIDGPSRPNELRTVAGLSSPGIAGAFLLSSRPVRDRVWR